MNRHRHPVDLLPIRAAAVGTALIGVIWMAIALMYCTDAHDLLHQFVIGAAVAIAGITVHLIIDWIEARR